MMKSETQDSDPQFSCPPNQYSLHYIVLLLNGYPTSDTDDPLDQKGCLPYEEIEGLYLTIQFFGIQENLRLKFPLKRVIRSDPKIDQENYQNSPAISHDMTLSSLTILFILRMYSSLPISFLKCGT